MPGKRAFLAYISAIMQPAVRMQLVNIFSLITTWRSYLTKCLRHYCMIGTKGFRGYDTKEWQPPMWVSFQSHTFSRAQSLQSEFWFNLNIFIIRMRSKLTLRVPWDEISKFEGWKEEISVFNKRIKSPQSLTLRSLWIILCEWRKSMPFKSSFESLCK